MTKKRQRDPYHFCVTFPERVFPFASYIDGQKVRWSRSYEHKLAEIQQTLGEGRYGLRLGAYREAFHIIGAGLVILTATLISHTLWGNDVALPVLFIVAMIVITFQEFYIQPRTYKQRLGKGVLDWISWVVPLSLYLFIYIF